MTGCQSAHLKVGIAAEGVGGEYRLLAAQLL